MCPTAAVLLCRAVATVPTAPPDYPWSMENASTGRSSAVSSRPAMAPASTVRLSIHFLVAFVSRRLPAATSIRHLAPARAARPSSSSLTGSACLWGLSSKNASSPGSLPILSASFPGARSSMTSVAPCVRLASGSLLMAHAERG